MRPSRLRSAVVLVLNLLASLCVLQNLWESGVPVVRYAWAPAAAVGLYVIARGARAFRLFLRSRDSDAACLIFLAAASFLSLFFARGPGAETVNAGLWGRFLGSIARVLRFHETFGSWWFMGLTLLLAAALAMKVASRRAWTRRAAGLSVARAGMLLVLAAGLVWKTTGARGWVDLYDGQWSDVALDADSMGTFPLPFAVHLKVVGPDASVTLIRGEEPLARGDAPLSRGQWRICAREVERHRASLYVVRDPGWHVALVGLVLLAAGFIADAAVNRGKRWP